MEQRFIDNGDGTITDTLRRVQWKKHDSYQDLMRFLTFPQAKKYMEKINREQFAGHADWRLPTREEAESLFEKESTVLDKYEMEVHINPIFPSGGGYNTWTSLTRGKITAFVFSYNSGKGGHQETESTLNSSVRLVRPL